jgi:UDP-glucose 4-epimerase
MKKILITGGAGYIGSHTAVALVNAGFEPIIIDNFSNSEKSALTGLKKICGKDITCYEVDCLDRAGVERVFLENDFFGVIHFAAFKAVGESTRLPLKYYSNNIDSLLILLEIMSKFGVKDIVFSSSCTVYGQPDILPVKESTPRQPAESPYGNTKKICEDILVDYIKSGVESRIVSLRYFNPVGAHPSGEIGELPLGIPNNLVPFITQTAAGLREKLTVFGDKYNTPDGTCIRDYIHVMDLADAHVKSLEYLFQQKNNFFDIFNVGTGNGNTVLEVIKAFEKVSSQSLNYEIGLKRDGDIEKVWADTEKINQILGWEAKYSLEDSLRDSWNWQKRLGEKVV